MAKILVVDDNPQIIKMIRRRLKKAGHEIYTAVNGQIGVEEAQRIQPNLILMDMHMPIMNGYTAVRTLRQQGYTGLISALTASATTDDVPKAIAAGCDFFIAKPIENDFEQQLADILAR